MHVLVTRPIQDSFEIILELKKRSYDFTHIPLLKIDYLDVKEINLKEPYHSMACYFIHVCLFHMSYLTHTNNGQRASL